MIGRVFGAAQQIRSATVFPFNLPPIIGLSTSGGFEYQLQNLEGRDPAEMGGVMHGLLGAANQDPRLARVFSTFSATHAERVPRHRPRQGAGARAEHQRRVHRAAGHAGRHLRQRLQPVRPHLAGQHPGRGDDRNDIPAIWKIFVRNKPRHHGAAALDRRDAHRDRPADHQPLQQLPLDHHQRRPGARASRRATRWRRWPQVSANTLPPGYDYEWTGTAYQEIAGAAARPARSSRWRCCSPTCSWSRCTKAG